MLSFKRLPSWMSPHSDPFLLICAEVGVVVVRVGQKCESDLIGAPHYPQSSNENVVASEKSLLNIYLSTSVLLQ